MPGAENDKNSMMQYDTLKRNKEFSRVYARGKSFATKRLVLVYLPRRYGGVRVGFTVSKKVGNSVTRNRLRRRFREAYRTYLDQLNVSAHIIFIARAPVADAEFREILDDMRYLLKKAQLIEKKPEIKKNEAHTVGSH